MDLITTGFLRRAATHAQRSERESLSYDWNAAHNLLQQADIS